MIVKLFFEIGDSLLSRRTAETVQNSSVVDTHEVASGPLAAPREAALIASPTSRRLGRCSQLGIGRAHSSQL